MDYEKQIKNLISHKAGMDLEEITEESFLEDDLNLGELEITELFNEIEEIFAIDLSEEKEEIETVENLVDAVSEKIE